ncbi:MAG: aspartate/glutamate racemase family protein [Rhodospirillales bacterium]|jgi:hypothetical protein|nr:aspartate/glutamate racemase family protein [Rhodospirillales bacterium]MDP7652749.1 aspartate/glutamate racemase family protein [Rhodospirillales bacterium]
MTDRTAFGGKTIYGARVGILILDAKHPRIPGDPNNAGTWPFPVLYKVVRQATPGRIIFERGEGLLDAFKAGADELIAEGADGITATCGFLALFQKDLAMHCKIPVATSSLMQVPFVQRLLPPGKRVGVLTVWKSELSTDHLEAAGVPADTPIGGTDNGREFNRTMYEALPEVDMAACEEDVVEAGRELVAENPDIGAVVVECTRMVPFTRALSEAIGMPVYDVYNFICWFHAGLAPRDFG